MSQQPLFPVHDVYSVSTNKILMCVHDMQNTMKRRELEQVFVTVSHGRKQGNLLVFVLKKL
jgi:hypothetical protein